MKSENKIRIAALVMALLLFISIIGMAVLTNKNNRLSSSVDAEKLKSEELLSEKISLEKQINDFRRDMKNLEGRNKDLDMYLTDAQNKLGEKETSIAKLLKDNASIKVLKKENEAIKKMKNDLNAQLEELKKTNSDLAKQVGQLNSTIASLNQEKENLQTQLANPKTPMIATNFMVEVRKKKEEKLTVKAKKTRSIGISFELPKGHALGNFYRVDLLSPAGKLIGGKVKAVDTKKAGQLTASLKSAPAKDNVDKVSLAFEPEEKLEKGIYSIVIYNGNQYLGSAQVKLLK